MRTVLEAKPGDPSQFIAIIENKIVRQPLLEGTPMSFAIILLPNPKSCRSSNMNCWRITSKRKETLLTNLSLAVASTKAVAKAIEDQKFERAVDLRGAEFAEYLDAYVRSFFKIVHSVFELSRRMLWRPQLLVLVPFVLRRTVLRQGSR